MNLFLILLASVAIICPVVCFAACNLYCHSQSVAVMERWAKREGYRISRRTRRFFFGGPYLWLSGGEIVFRVIMEDRDGLESVVWVNCGNPLLNLKDPPDVQWGSSP